MFSTLDVEVRPGVGLDSLFEIGTSLWTLLERIRRLQHAFPQLDVKYDPDTSATTPILIHIRPHLDLLFSGKHQRLHTICVRKLRDEHPPVILRYKESIMSSPAQILRRIGVTRVFGPTFPGNQLRYPGLWFSFEEDGIREGMKRSQAEERAQEIKRVFISQKDADSNARDALDEVHECAVMHGDISRAIIKVHDGIVLHFYPEATSTPLHIRLGQTTAQDLILDLGSPLRVHHKEDNRMMIHASSNTSESEDDKGYFYNYFQHGIDFLMSESTHTVKKIILHTNVPGSPMFQRYKRCNWEIEGNPGDDEDDSPPRKAFHERFETINHFLRPKEPPLSIVLDRTDDDDDLILPSPITRLHGYDGIILEVTESSQVVSVMLY